MRTTPLEWHDASNTSEDHPFRETLCLVEIATPPGAKTREFATAYRMNGIWIRNNKPADRTDAASWASLANVEDLDFRDAAVKTPEDGSYVLVRHAIPTAVKKAMKLSPAPLYPVALSTARYADGRWQTPERRTLRANQAEKIEWVPLDAFSHPAGSTPVARDATTSTEDDGIPKIQFMEVPHNAEIAALMAIIERSRKEIHSILGVPTNDEETMKAMRADTGLNRAHRLHGLGVRLRTHGAGARPGQGRNADRGTPDGVRVRRGHPRQAHVGRQVVIIDPDEGEAHANADGMADARAPHASIDAGTVCSFYERTMRFDALVVRHLVDADDSIWGRGKPPPGSMTSLRIQYETLESALDAAYEGFVPMDRQTIPREIVDIVLGLDNWGRMVRTHGSLPSVFAMPEIATALESNRDIAEMAQAIGDARRSVPYKPLYAEKARRLHAMDPRFA
jgi:hypothetical protein